VNAETTGLPQSGCRAPFPPRREVDTKDAHSRIDLMKNGSRRADESRNPDERGPMQSRTQPQDISGINSVPPTLFIGISLHLSSAARSLVAWLEERTAKTGSTSLAPDADQENRTTSNVPADRWLSHEEAARYLGLSKSTLYRYAGREWLEARKFAGRLQYRTTALDRFQNHHLRPADRKSSLVSKMEERRCTDS
jgi:excisionase family DNA binding protein